MIDTEVLFIIQLPMHFTIKLAIIWSLSLHLVIGMDTGLISDQVESAASKVIHEVTTTPLYC